MAMTPQDLASIKEIMEASIANLKELFIEKLNGHGENSERHGKQIDQLYTLDRQRAAEIAYINASLVRIEGKVDAHAEVSKVEENARDKKEAAVDGVADKFTAKAQFSVSTWVAIILAIAGPLIVAAIMGAFK